MQVWNLCTSIATSSHAWPHIVRWGRRTHSVSSHHYSVSILTSYYEVHRDGENHQIIDREPLCLWSVPLQPLRLWSVPLPGRKVSEDPKTRHIHTTLDPHVACFTLITHNPHIYSPSLLRSSFHATTVTAAPARSHKPTDLSPVHTTRPRSHLSPPRVGQHQGPELQGAQPAPALLRAQPRHLEAAPLDLGGDIRLTLRCGAWCEVMCGGGEDVAGVRSICLRGLKVLARATRSK